MHTLKDFNVRLEESKLSNGVKVLLLKKEKSPICIEVVIASGSSFDPGEKEGLAHFTEHMLLAGSKSFPTKDKIASYIENIGGYLGAKTRSEILSVRIEIVEKSDLKNVSTILKEIFTESLFLKDSVEIERKTILSEKSSRDSSPARLVWNLFAEIAFQETSYEHRVIGNTDSIKAITRKDLVEFYKNMIVSGRVFVVVSGDVEMDELVASLESGLNIKETEQFKFDNELSVVRNKTIRVENFPNQKNVDLIIGFRTCPITNPDTYPLYIISEVLGGGRSSILKRELRYKRGLVYGVGSTVNNFVRVGLVAVKTSVPRRDLQESLDIITKEFKRVADGELNSEEIESTKTRIIKSKIRSLQTSGAWVNEHIPNYLAGKAVSVSDELNSLEKVTINDIKTVGKKYFRNNSWYLAMCGDVGEKDFSIKF